MKISHIHLMLKFLFHNRQKYRITPQHSFLYKEENILSLKLVNCPICLMVDEFHGRYGPALASFPPQVTFQQIITAIALNTIGRQAPHGSMLSGA